MEPKIALPPDSLHLVAARNAQGNSIDHLTDFSKKIVDLCFSEKKPIIAGIEEARELGCDAAAQYNLRSIMAVPVLSQDETIGVAYLDSKLTKGLFSDEDLGLLSILSQFIAATFEASRMAKIELEKAHLEKDLEIQSAIASEAKKVQILVDSMQQALFSINSKFQVIEPVSKFSAKILGPDIIDKQITDVLYKDLPSENEQTLMSALSTVFGEDDLQWSLMESNFPRKLGDFVNPAIGQNGDKLSIKIQPSPIWDDNGNLERIVFVVEDITSLEALEKQVSKSRKQAAMLEELINNESEVLEKFFQTANEFFSRYEQALSTNLPFELKPYLRDLHTLKGNARLYKASSLSQEIHEVESNILKFNTDGAAIEVLRQIGEELKSLKQTFAEYVALFKKIFHENRSKKSSAFNESAFIQMQNFVQADLQKADPKLAHQLRYYIERLSYRSARSLVENFSNMIKEISLQLDKSITFEVAGEALLSARQHDGLQECLLHLIRNAIDHGIESKEERRTKNKPESGSLKVELKEDVDKVSITIRDDGRGIDGDRVGESAIRKGIVQAADLARMSLKDKQSLIFAAGFSTKETATEISGRGIGMDVVKTNISELGGLLDFESVPGLGSTFSISFNHVRN